MRIRRPGSDCTERAGGRDRLQSLEALPRKLHLWSETKWATKENCSSMLGFVPRPDSPIFANCWKNIRRQEAIMVVGHNPNLSQFLGAVISDSGCEASIELKKGAVAKVEMRPHVGTLQWCVTPKLLRTLYDTAVESSRPKTSRK